MSISDLTAAQLKGLVLLIREKEALHAKLAKVNAALAQFDAAPVPPAQRHRRKKSRRTGKTMKDSILDVLAQAGTRGFTVKEIAAEAGLKEGSVSVWMYTSGRKTKGLKKIAPGKFAYQRS